MRNRLSLYLFPLVPVFFRQNNLLIATYFNYVEQFYQRQNTRVAAASFTYHSGNDTVYSSRRRTGEDEKR